MKAFLNKEAVLALVSQETDEILSASALFPGRLQFPSPLLNTCSYRSYGIHLLLDGATSGASIIKCFSIQEKQAVRTGTWSITEQVRLKSIFLFPSNFLWAENDFVQRSSHSSPPLRPSLKCSN